MPLDDLRIIVLNERETGRLSEVPPNLHDKIRSRVASLQEQVYGSADPFSDKAQTLIEEVKAVLEIMNDIFRIRSRKILSLALVRLRESFPVISRRKPHFLHLSWPPVEIMRLRHFGQNILYSLCLMGD